MTISNSFIKGLVALIIGASLLGLSAIFVKFSDSSPSTTAFYRALLALPFLYIWILIDKKQVSNWNMPENNIFKYFLFAGLFFALDMSIWNWSIQFTSVAHATLMANTAPIFVTFLGYIFFKEHIKPLFLLALSLAILGVVIVVQSGSGNNESRLFGDSLGLIAAIFYAGYIVSIKQLTRFISPAQILFYATLVTALFLLPLAIFESDEFLPASNRQWLLLIGYAFVSQTLAQGLITYGISKLTAHLSSLTLLVQPIAAAFYGWLLLGESLVLFQILGGLLVLFAIYLASIKANPS
jgi:drug/metabolite transporter (DMT)-like permease|tara:strand:- start:860 stop:1747 length:888 start_codon:yes stop_codon:yes gene_type:complete